MLAGRDKKHLNLNHYQFVLLGRKREEAPNWGGIIEDESDNGTICPNMGIHYDTEIDPEKAFKAFTTCWIVSLI